MAKQMTLFDFMPKLEPEVGEWADTAGAIIPVISLHSYIGKKVMMDKSTVGHTWFHCGVLEKVIDYEDHKRAIVYDGGRQRNYITYPWSQLHECCPWEWYEKRMQMIGRKQ